jgi:hypothetical protein
MRANGFDRFYDLGKTVGQVVVLQRKDPDSITVLGGKRAVSVPFHFVKPLRPHG